MLRKPTALLGCPKIDGAMTLLAEFSNCVLIGAALCAGLVKAVDDEAGV